MIKCPLCGYKGYKALVGIFPIRCCYDEECSCVWGFWSSFALWLQDKLSPGDEWSWLHYEGSYLDALIFSLRGKK